jgi:hypothetical protein
MTIDSQASSHPQSDPVRQAISQALTTTPIVTEAT